MPMGEGSDNLEGLFCGHIGLALKDSSNDLNRFGGEVRDVAEGFVFDRSAFALGTPEEVGDVDLTRITAVVILVGPCL